MINIAILGTGQIVPEAADAIRQSKKFNLKYIWTPHSQDKAAAIAEKFGIQNVSTDLDEILNDSETDFVYVALVNSVHFEYAKKILSAGKNVILEKPFTSNSHEAEELANLAAEKKLYLFEAITNLHMPNFYALKDALKKIGEIKIVQGNYSQYSSRYDNYKQKKVAPAFDPKFQGGALRDINVYNINLTAALFGLPKKISYKPNRGWNSVDTSGILSLDYENFLAVCVAAKDSGSPSYFTVQGDNGYVKLDGPPNQFPALEIFVRGEKVERINLNKFDNRMVHEFIEFAEIFESKNYSRVEEGLETSKIVMKIIETAAES